MILSQSEHMEKVLESFIMQNAKPSSIPLASHFLIMQGYVS